MIKKIFKTNNMNQSSLSPSGYKRTTDKQYSLLTHEMVRVRVENRTGKSADAIIYWNSLTEKLNALGPPYRTVAQWKKVWTDFRRFHSKRNFKSTPKFTKTIKTESNISSEIFGIDDHDEDDEVTTSFDYNNATPTTINDLPQAEWEEYDQNSQSINSTNSNDYTDEYSYPDRQSMQQLTPELPETLIPDDTNYDDSCTYNPPNFQKNTTKRTINRPTISNQRTLPPLRPSNNLLLDQTLYTLQNQMENQTKLLEHLSQISGTMAGLMERQVIAVEKQTEAMRRQASATEHHTLVMNSFIDMIRDKMPKKNSRTTTTPTFNLSNGGS